MRARFTVRHACVAGALWVSALQPAYPQSTDAGAHRRLYVEPFATTTAAEKLRADVIAELRRAGTVLVSGESDADVVLGGGGEIWTRGYRSLNPRSGRSPSNGIPVYGGYLSVELRDRIGDTLWSWLATPGEGTGDIFGNLAKQIAKRVADQLAHDVAPLPESVAPQRRVTLKGAGATFPYPVYAKWFTNYRRANPAVEMMYDAVGSEAGVRGLLAGAVDFGATDNPGALHQMAPSEESKYLFFPSVVGAVVPIVNVPGVTGEISFSPGVLAGIYLGRIKKWNDPALRKINPRLRLPDLDIVVVHRSDGSGTTFAWTDYLSQTNPEWKAQVGSGMAPSWPVGREANGNEGVTSMVKELGGSIGYVEFIYALQQHLNYGKVRNANGEYVAASLESIGIAAKNTMEISDDLKVSLANAPGAGAYPISSFTWIVVPSHIGDDSKRDAVTGFLKWMIGPGQRQAAALGYVALPKDLIGREAEAIAQIR